MKYLILMFLYFVLRGLNAVWIKKSEPKENGLSESLTFTTMFSLFQLVTLFIFTPFSWKPIEAGWQIWPLCYALFFILAYVFLFKAFAEGSASVSNAVFSFYIIVPIIAGVFLWEEHLSLLKIAGLALFLLSVLIFNKSSYQSPEGKKAGFSSKWLLYIILATACSGIGVIFTRESIRTAAGYDKEYIALYNLFVVLAGLPVLIKNRKKVVSYLKDMKWMLYTLGAAITQNIMNIIFILYLNEVESVIFLPLIGVLNIVSVMVAGRILLKEKFAKNAYIGVAVSIVSLFILNF